MRTSCYVAAASCLFTAYMAQASKLYLRCSGIDKDRSLHTVWAKERDSYAQIEVEYKGNETVLSDKYYDEIKSVCESSLRASNVDTSFFSVKASPHRFSKDYTIVFKHDRTFDKIVIFGDSMSDEGKLYKNTLHKLPALPYWQGRFSDGPIWSEYAFSHHGIPVINNSTAGQMTSFSKEYESLESRKFRLFMRLRQWFTSDAQGAVSRHIKHEDFNKDQISKNLYMFLLGGVNYLIAAEREAFKQARASGDTSFIRSYSIKVAQDLSRIVKRLYESGARQFILFTLPDFSLLPDDSPVFPMNKPFLGEFTKYHNEELTYVAANLQNKLPGAKVRLFDGAATMKRFLLEAPSYGIKETKSSCFQGGWSGWDKTKFSLCQHPESYLFFDSVHPTSYTHCLFSYEVMNFMSREAFVSDAERSKDEIIQTCQALLTKHPNS